MPQISDANPIKMPERNERPDIRLVLSDLDGTLLNPYGRLSQFDIESIHLLRRQGIHFTFATGRPDCMVRIFAEELGIDEPIVSCNGAVIRSPLTGHVAHLQTMDPRDALTCIRYLRERDMDYLVYDKDCIYYPHHSLKINAYRDYNRRADARRSSPCKICPMDFEHIPPALLNSIVKIYVNDPALNSIEPLKVFLAGETKLTAASSSTRNLDIAPAGESKGRALLHLADFYGIRPEQVCVFGDNDNDVEMFRRAGLAIAMGNAAPACRAAANLISASNAVAGVGRAIRQWLLP